MDEYAAIKKHDSVAKVKDAKYHAQQEGIKKGIKALAKKMIALGYDSEQIMQLTSFTIEEVLVASLEKGSLVKSFSRS